MIVRGDDQMRREEENNQSSNQSKENFNAKQFLRKRWILPAVYLGAAAIVLSAFFFMQGGEQAIPPENNNSQEEGIVFEGADAVPVTSANETFKMPVVDENEVEVIGYFYDYDASPEEQQAALVYYNNTYYQNKGIDIASKDGESFEVTAALSGTVVKAEEDSLLGYVVQINHDNGVVTHYQSLGNISVEVGATVKQGDVIGSAGRNLYNSEAGVHVHFAIRHNGEAVNPLNFINQTIETLVDEKQRSNEDAASVEEENAENEDKEKEAEKEKEDNKDKEAEDA